MLNSLRIFPFQPIQKKISNTVHGYCQSDMETLLLLSNRWLSLTVRTTTLSKSMMDPTISQCPWQNIVAAQH